MKQLTVLLAGLLLAFSGPGAAFAQAGTAAEARAMLDRAVAALKADQAAALAKFESGADGFKDRDLYVFCFSMQNGQLSVHPTLKGQDVRALRDSNGQAFGQASFDAVAEGQVSTVDYTFPRPGGGAPAPKQSFVTRVGGQGCGVGYYK